MKIEEIEKLELKAEKLLEVARSKATESKEKETEERAKKALEIAEEAVEAVREAKELQETSEKLKTAETEDLSEAAAKAEEKPAEIGVSIVKVVAKAAAAKAAEKAEKAEIRVSIAEKAVEAIVKEVAVKAEKEALEKEVKEIEKSLGAEGNGLEVLENDLQSDKEKVEKKIELLREEETNAIKELTEAYEAAALAGSNNQQIPEVNQSSEYQSGSINQDSDDSSDSESLSEVSGSIHLEHSDSIYSVDTDHSKEEYIDELSIGYIETKLNHLINLLDPNKEALELDDHRVEILIGSVEAIQGILKNINDVLSEDINSEKNLERYALIPLEDFKKVIEEMQKKVDNSFKKIEGKDIVKVEKEFKKLSNELKKNIEKQNNNFEKIKEEDKAKELVDLLAKTKPSSIEEKPKSSFKNLFTSPSVWISLSFISFIVGLSTGIGPVVFAGMIVGGLGVGLFIKKKFWDNTYKKWKQAKNLKKELKKFSLKEGASLQEENNIGTAEGINEEILNYANKFGGVEKARPYLMKLFQNVDPATIKELRDSLIINKHELSDEVQENQSDRSQELLNNFKTRIIGQKPFVTTRTIEKTPIITELREIEQNNDMAHSKFILEGAVISPQELNRNRSESISSNSTNHKSNSNAFKTILRKAYTGIKKLNCKGHSSVLENESDYDQSSRRSSFKY